MRRRKAWNERRKVRERKRRMGTNTTQRILGLPEEEEAGMKL